MIDRRTLTLLSLLTFLTATSVASGDEPPAFDGLARTFDQRTRPLLEQFCLKCHSTEMQEGDLDLEQFAKLEHVRRAPRVWQKVVEMLDNGEMPPKKSPQPSGAQRRELRGWARSYLDAEARANAGDPGSVVLRRLSHVEYDNTIRDLTGIDLRPAREFPVDGAAGEGFTNVGEALVMSPAMLDKYVAAAKGMAAHAVLLPEGFRFSEGATRRDWTDEIVAQIRQIYRQHTTPEGSRRVNLQGLDFLAEAGGRIPLERYLAATIEYRDSHGLSGKAIAEFAVENHLSPKYIQTLWDLFNGKDSSALLGAIRDRWRTSGLGNVTALASEIRQWQACLTKFNSVAHFKRWLEPVNPLVESQTFRIKIEPAPDAREIVVRLVTRDVGDGRSGDVVEWCQARLESPGRPPHHLQDLRKMASKPRPSNGVETPLASDSPSVLEIRLPADLAKGREFVVTAALGSDSGEEGCVQAQVIVDSRPIDAHLVPGVPILVRNGSKAKLRIEKSMEDFRSVFPAALCYSQIVPVDEVVTLVLFHREDEPLTRLILDEPERRKLDRLWDELRYVSQDALKVQEAYGQFMEYVTQDGDVRLFEPLRKPIAQRAEALSKRLLITEPCHLDSLVEFAAQAYRRPMSPREQAGLRDLYANLRNQNLDHDAAFRLTLTRVLMSPSFLYHIEQPSGRSEAQPVSEWELASRLSYTLWSSMPDDELRRLAAEGKLHEPAVLAVQVRRMLKDQRVRALATEFACQWLDIRGFDSHNEKSEKVFPEFAGLRGAMYEESVRFFVDLFQRDGSLLEVLDADHTFVNEALARHYGIPGVSGPEWRRVDGVKSHGRGGILGMSTLLAKQSGASRTSPILRGNWLAEMLLGEKLPKPPKNVPQLPESELDTNGLTLRQITEKHREIVSCAKCHDRIDPFGFALEGFDAIGRRRTTDLAGRPIDTKVRLKNGTEFADISGLRDYVLSQRREEFLKHFCRKLLGYSLGRSVQLSDEPLLVEIRRSLIDNDYHVQAAILAVIQSPQFRLRRGLESSLDQELTNP